MGKALINIISEKYFRRQTGIITNLFKKHYLIVIVALAVGLATLMPQIIAIMRVDGFQGIYKPFSDDENYYMARAKDITDGNYFLSNPYLYEYKKSLPMQYWLSDFILAVPLSLLGVNIHVGYLFYDFILPIILTFLTYAILFLLTKKISLSLIGAIFLHLGLFLNDFNRSPSPQLIFIFWQLTVLFWLLYLNKKSAKKALILGASLGFLFYLYPYYWTFYLLTFFIFILSDYYLEKKFFFKEYALILTAAFFIALPYLVITLKSMQLPFYKDTLARMGMINTHFPDGRRIVMWGIIVLALAFFFYRKDWWQAKTIPILLLSGVLGCVLVTNQHIITGKNLQFNSHYWILSAFWYVFTFLYLVNCYLKKENKFKYYIFSGLIIWALVVCGRSLLDNFKFSYDQNYIERQGLSRVFQWLNQNTQKEDVIFTSNKLSELIPIYTSNNVYYAWAAELFLMPNKEIQERYLINNYWEKIDESSVQINYRPILGQYYRLNNKMNSNKNKIRKLLGLEPKYYPAVPADQIKKFVDFSDQIKKGDFEAQLKKYRADYLIWDKKSNPDWLVQNLTFLDLEYQEQDIAVYKIR